MALIAGILHLLTHFMSSQGLLFLLVISWIFWLKKKCLAFLTILLNCFQSLICLVDLYILRLHLQLLFHQLLECLVILTIFKCFSHVLFIEWVRLRTLISSESLFKRSLILTELITLMSSSINDFSLSLFLTIIYFLVWKYSLIIGMVIVRGT